MNDPRVILITVTSPEGRSADVGARSDATPADLAAHLGADLGTDLSLSVVQHHAPARPGGQPKRHRLIRADAPLAASGVLDGDTLVFTRGQSSAQPDRAAPATAHDARALHPTPTAVSIPVPVQPHPG